MSKETFQTSRERAGNKAVLANTVRAEPTEGTAGLRRWWTALGDPAPTPFELAIVSGPIRCSGTGGTGS